MGAQEWSKEGNEDKRTLCACAPGDAASGTMAFPHPDCPQEGTELMEGWGGANCMEIARLFDESRKDGLGAQKGLKKEVLGVGRPCK